MSRKGKRIERELTDGEKEILIAVGRCSRELADLLAGARRRAQRSSSVFVTEHIASSLHRGIEAYAEMFHKLKVPGRQDVDRLLGRHSRLEEIQDMADEIADTEGCWRNFLGNLERELDLGVSEEEAAFDEGVDAGEQQSAEDDKPEEEPKPKPDQCPYRCRAPAGLEAALGRLAVVDPRTSRPVTLRSLMEPFRCLLVLCLPAYLPFATMRWYMSQLDKIKDDLSYFRCGVVGITWGLKDHGKRWSKDVKSSFPIYLDTKQELIDICHLSRGLSKMWGTSTLMHLAEMQRAKVPVDLPPENVKWDQLLHLGCAFVLRAAEKKEHGPKLLHFHRSKTSVGDLPAVGFLREMALDNFCSSTDQQPEAVLAGMDRERRYRRSPDPSRLQLEPSSGMYYDPDTRFYYDPRSQYYYDGDSGRYVYWSDTQGCYVSAEHMYAAGPSYYQVRALMQQQEADIYAKAAAIVDARAAWESAPPPGPVEEGEPKPPGT